MKSTELHLIVLKQRNRELEMRCRKLLKLSRKVEENISKLQDTFELLLNSQEQECQSMVNFDEEIIDIKKKLFSQKKVNNMLSYDEIQRRITEEVKYLKEDNNKDFEKYIIEKDPVLKGLSEDVKLIYALLENYPFLKRCDFGTG